MVGLLCRFRGLATLIVFAHAALACSYDYAAASHCRNGTQDRDEADVDCGGSCVSASEGRCGYGKLCNAPSDCDDEVARCELGRCTPHQLTASWRLLATEKPTPRFGARLTFRGSIGVLFGGLQATAVAPDMWTLESGIWHRREISVQPRYYHAQASYPPSNVVVIAGGEASGVGRFKDAWSINSQNDFTPLPPLAQERTKAAMVYDSLREQLLLFGGQAGAGATLSQPLLVRKSASAEDDWQPLVLRSTPLAPYWHAMVYDDRHDTLVVFGGRAAGQAEGLQTTSILDLTTHTWKSSEYADGPSARWGAMMAYDTHRKRAVLFGGKYGDDATSNPYDDTWEWDGESWTRMLPSPDSPVPPRNFNGAMSYDPTFRRMILLPGPVSAGFKPLDPSETWGYAVLGWPCGSGEDCGEGTFCVDNLCCDAACAGGSCTERDQPGICTAP